MHKFEGVVIKVPQYQSDTIDKEKTVSLISLNRGLVFFKFFHDHFEAA